MVQPESESARTAVRPSSLGFSGCPPQTKQESCPLSDETTCPVFAPRLSGELAVWPSPKVTVATLLVGLPF